jgi:hypothetical protein
MEQNSTRDQLDLLHKIESLAENINKTMSERNQPLLRRYPITFTLIALFGVVAISEGAKGILESIPFFSSHPLFLLLIGLFILTGLGLLFKKLE